MIGYERNVAPAPGWIKGTRKKFGLTQAELATLLRVSRQTVINWESGKHPMKPRDYDYMKMKLTEGV